MRIFEKRKKAAPAAPTIVQTAREQGHPFQSIRHYTPLAACENRLYDSLREAIPVIDAAIGKIVRLVGGCSVVCEDKRVEKELATFLSRVKVGASAYGLESFLAAYLDSLLTYGTAVGEIVPNALRNGIGALYNASLDDIDIRPGKTPLDVEFFLRDERFGAQPVPYPELLLFTALNPAPGEVMGRSLLKGLPFVSSILLQIYNAIGLNWERIGNIRFAVTYKPQNDTLDKAYAKERAMAIAKEWSSAMQSGKDGRVSDFIAVGDVNIRVIGADNQIIDSNVPVRQMLEQIVAKLGIPPFLLGLNFSTTERMSQQQCDILTSELEYYRRILNPVVAKIVRFYLSLSGNACDFDIAWDNISLQDEVELANARLLNAQAEQIEAGIKGGETK